MQRTRLRQLPPDWVTKQADKAEARLKRGPVRTLHSTGNPHIDELVRQDDIERHRRKPKSRIKHYEKYHPDKIPEDEIGEPLDLVESVLRPGRPLALEDHPSMRRLIYGLASIQCTKDEAAACLSVTPQTFNRFLARCPEIKAIWDNGQPAGRVSLRRKQFMMADKSASMAIWLGKQLLDQRDKLDVGGPGGGPLQSITVDASQLAKLTPLQRKALQEALQIIRPEMFDGTPQAEEPQQIEYDPDSPT